MVVYLESRAALSWLFGKAGASPVVRAVEGASLVVTSELTGMECARAIHRARAAELVTAAQAASLLDDYRAAAGQWDHLPIRDRVTHLAAAPWPVEPVRTLDAIHLGSVLLAWDAWPELRVLTFDRRLIANLAALGVPVVT